MNIYTNMYETTPEIRTIPLIRALLVFPRLSVVKEIPLYMYTALKGSAHSGYVHCVFWLPSSLPPQSPGQNTDYRCMCSYSSNRLLRPDSHIGLWTSFTGK